MKARGLRNVVPNVTAQLPVKPVTRAAVKRQPLQAINKKADPVDSRELKSNAKHEVGQCMEVDQVLAPVVPASVLDTSIERLYRQVGDVDSDENDKKNAELVSYYVKDIFSYLLSIECTQQVKKDFLCQPNALEITPRMRRILFEWLVEVHKRYSLLPETLYLSFHIIDYYMCVCGGEVKKTNYQLLGVTAMFLASKYEEIYPPEIGDFVYLTDNTYSVSELHEMERQLLCQLEFFLGYPLEIQFLRRYSKVAQATTPVHEMAKYLTELSRTSYELAHLPPSGLAAAGFCLACELLADAPDAQPHDWTPQLEVFSGYSKDSLVPTIRKIAKLVLLMQTETKHTAVKRKYASRSFSSISASRQLADPANPVLVHYCP